MAKTKPRTNLRAATSRDLAALTDGAPSRNEVAVYVRKCARILRVGITVRVKFDPDLNLDLWAMHESRRRDHSLFIYGYKLLTASERSWRQTVAHELVHCHLRHFRHPLEAAENKLGPGFLDWYEDTEEEVADRLEVVLARLLPKPPWC